MSLSSALSIAQSSIRNTARQTSIVSRNVLEANNPDYNRRTAALTNSTGARAVEIQRAANEQLFRQNLQAVSAFNGQSTLSTGMERLNLSINGVENSTSPATALGKLQEALQLYSAAPSNRNLAETTLDAARQVVRTLNDGTSAIQSFRTVADQEISTAVSELNNLLADSRDSQQRGNFRHQVRARHLRCARPARRDAEADRRIRADLDLHARRQRHGRHDKRRATRSSRPFRAAVSFTPTGVYSPGTTGNKVYHRRRAGCARHRRQHRGIGPHRRDDPAPRRRHRHHAGPARRNRPRPDLGICRDRRRPTLFPRRRASSPGSARRPCRPPARW